MQILIHHFVTDVEKILREWHQYLKKKRLKRHGNGELRGRMKFSALKSQSARENT